MYIAYYKERKNFKLKKIIKVFFCILICLIINIPQIYAEESKSPKELSEENVEKKEEKQVVESTKETTTKSTTKTEEIVKEPSIYYTTHVQDLGWQKQVKDGEIAGTEGKSKRLEAIKISLQDLKDVKIKYQTHIQDIGWQGWKYDGNLSGTEGQSKRLEAIKIELEESDKYTVMYRVHIQDIGWQDWKYDGETAGTEGQSKRLEAIQIKIVEKKTRISVRYTVHVQDVGWQNWRNEGNLAGTEGQSKRLEGIKIELSTNIKNAKLKYRVHVQDVGWQNWKNNGEFAGTEGQSKRLEAIQIKLENTEDYSIEYRVHVQDLGWQDWANDGEIAGTEGQSKRLETIQIRIIPKARNNRIQLYIDTPKKVAGAEKTIIKGWLMSNYDNNNIRYFLNNQLIETETKRTERTDVLEAVKGYGGKDLNPLPGFESEIDFTEYEGENVNLKIQVLDDKEKIIEEKVINLVIKPKMEQQEGIYGKTGLEVAKQGGSELKYLKYGTGENVLFATFAIHGYEDKWDKDGYELVEIANKFYNKLFEERDYELAEKWTIYIFPGVNQDGLQKGSTNNGPGRTTLYSQAPENKGIDLNRCWQIGDTYEKFTSDRNYNGEIGFQAYEAQALRDFMLENKSKNGQTILVDLHGWTQQLIGDENICSYYEKQFPENNKRSVGRYGSGYMISWARTYLGIQGKPAKTALIELPRDGVKNHQSVIDKDFSNRYINATMEMLKNII